MDSPPRASLIVVTYNSARVLGRFLATLAETRGVSYELIVVDNASTDTTRALLAELPHIQVIASASNLGFGRACNLGAAAARGDLLIFLNPDLTFTPTWLAELEMWQRSLPDAGVLAPATLYPDEPIVSQPEPPHEVASVSGAAMLIPRRAWERLGGFDEQIFLYWEDTDLCWRAWMAGLRVAHIPSAVIYHDRGGSGGGRAWAAEAAKHGVYVHLKLARWRRAIPYLLRQVAATLVRLARRQRGALSVWGWNLRHLARTMAARRRARANTQIEDALLERMIDQHDQMLRRRLWYTRGRRQNVTDS